MKPFDRMLCVTAGLLGLGAFVAGLTSGLAAGRLIGVAALWVELTVASLALRR